MDCRCALLTGAAGGLGSQIAKLLAAEGVELILLDREAELMEPLRAELGADAKVELVGVDLRDPEALAETLAGIVAGHPHLDLVVANAGIDRPHDALEPDWKAARDHLAINTTANMVLLSAVTPLFAKNGRGQFAVVASLAALRGFPFESSYCASKAAIVHYLEAVRPELRAAGIHVTTVFPGFLETPMVHGNAFRLSGLVSAERAARTIVRAIARKKRTVYFPKLALLKIWLLNALPAWLADWLSLHTAVRSRAEVFGR